jgi:hypothetical protein
MMNSRLSRRRLLRVALLSGGAAALAACSGNGSADTSAKSEGATDARRPVAGARQFADSELRDLLLPRGAVPLGLTPSGEYLLPNEEVAKFFPNPRNALGAMQESGRMQGAAADYVLPGTARANEQAVAVSSSVSWYRTAAAARSVILDPSMELVIHRFGLNAAEIEGEPVGQESRVFRGYRDGDGPDLAAYLVLFRRENLIGAIVLVMPSTTDDGGKLATTLARRQALIPLPSSPPR